jgi:hypothetical protein
MSVLPSVDPPALPIACTLGPVDGLDRMRRWQALSEMGRPAVTRIGPTLEVRYRPVAGVHAELVALAAAEQECCSFVAWTVADDRGQPVLRVSAADSPDDIAPIASLFGVT